MTPDRPPIDSEAADWMLCALFVLYLFLGLMASAEWWQPLLGLS